jgi:hypothetical protein
MIIDLTQVNNADADVDVCIIGAGPAGISAALALEEKGDVRVAVCEAGLLHYTDQSQKAYSGEVIGDEYFDLDICRLRFFGGSSNHWGGWCRPLDSHDFDRGYMGQQFVWPISKNHLDPFLMRACQILDIKSSDWLTTETSKESIYPAHFEFSPPTNFNSKYLELFARSENIALYLGANITDVTTENGVIKAVHGKNYTQKSNFSCSAKVYILACGGIENSRLLQFFYDKHGENLCSSNLPIGQYWMEHPHFTLGETIVPRKLLNQKYYTLHKNIQEKKKVLNCGFRIEGSDTTRLKELMIDLSCAVPSLAKPVYEMFKKNLICSATFRAAWEQAPDKKNRIELDYKKKDQFGIPRAKLIWKKGRLDRDTINESINTFLDWQQETKNGYTKLQDWLLKKEDYPVNDELAGYHHMGGTRMHTDPEFGVVDRDCKLFGSKNFYIAGSSIFTTGGHANPTLTITQLSLRLADHLWEIMKTY